jgi:hypothetical protein
MLRKHGKNTLKVFAKPERIIFSRNIDKLYVLIVFENVSIDEKMLFEG